MPQTEPTSTPNPEGAVQQSASTSPPQPLSQTDQQTVPLEQAPVQASPANQPSTGQAAQQTTQPTPETKPKRKNPPKPSRYLTIYFLIILAMLSLNSIAVYLTGVRIDQLNLTREQIVTAQVNNSNISSTSQFLESGQVQIEIINNALPNESTLINFVTTIENLANQWSSTSSLKFNAKNPTGDSNAKFIPFELNISTDMKNFQQFLTQLEKLPYLVEVDSIASTHTNLDQNLWDIEIIAKVYVQDPFRTGTTADL